MQHLSLDPLVIRAGVLSGGVLSHLLFDSFDLLTVLRVLGPSVVQSVSEGAVILPVLLDHALAVLQIVLTLAQFCL